MNIKRKRFLFEIPVESFEYSPETCERDYGSKECHNPDFPNYVYAFHNIQQLLKDASTHCRQAAMRMMANKKTELETWEKLEQDLYNRYLKRAEYWDEMIYEIKFVRMEEIEE
jgi:hypothetical protein